MKRGIQYVALFALIFSLSNCQKKSPYIFFDSRYKKEISAVRNELSVYLMLNNIPGGSFAISKDGKLIYSESMGFASKDLEVPATRKTKFRIGELSELFTSLIYQMMVENGTLNSDSAVQAYIPDYPLAPYKGTLNKITLTQLANHSSGIRKANPDEENWRGLNVSIINGIEFFKNNPLDFAPGWFENPSSYNYNLLGAIMEKGSGEKFPELLKKYVTDTLQLTNTEIDNPYRTVIGRTDFFDYNLVAQVVNATCQDFRYKAPSEGILSNAEDLVKFGNAVLNSDKISKQVKERLFEKTKLLGDFPPNIANGWIIQRNNNFQLYYGKTGKVTGGGAVLLIIPDEKLVVAGTINLTATDDLPVFRLIAPFLNQPDDNKKETDKQK